MTNPAFTALLHAGQRGAMARNTYLKERWRYQPVWVPAGVGPDILIVVRCIFDKDDKLRSWTEDMPEGDDAKDLARDLAWMMAAVYEWQPVAMDDLRVGMTFERTGVTVDDVLDHLEHAREFAGVTVAKRKAAEYNYKTAADGSHRIGPDGSLCAMPSYTHPTQEHLPAVWVGDKNAPLPAAPGTGAVHDADPLPGIVASLDAAGMEDSKGG